MARPLVGPIIGKVTSSKARILIEYPLDLDVEIILVSFQNQNERHKQMKQLKSRSPTIFAFKNLQPNTKYKVQINPYEGILDSSFSTMKKKSDKKDLKICWISCDDVRKGEKMDKKKVLWHNLAQEVKKDMYDIIIHIGDQVYLDSDVWYGSKDNCYSYCKQLVFDKYPKYQWPIFQNDILELIRNEYRRTFTFEPTAFVLANCSNLMFLDDHEVRDDFGWRREDWDPNTLKSDYFFSRMAQLAYYEYERQLWDENLDINNIQNITKEYTWFNIGKVAFFFLELRGHRTWHRKENFDNSINLGIEQWNEFQQVVKNEFEDCENLVIISQINIILLNSFINRLLYLQSDDVQEQWVNYEDQQINLLKILYNWKYQKQHREVIIVGGDLHAGGYTDIYFNKKKAFKQVTSSAITNGIVEKYNRLAIIFGTKLCSKLKNNFEFIHHDWTGKNNYGVTHIYNNKRGQNRVDFWHIIGPDQDESPKFERSKVFNNKRFKKRQQFDCCKVF